MMIKGRSSWLHRCCRQELLPVLHFFVLKYDTVETDRPPIISIISRQSGECRSWVCDRTNQIICRQLINPSIPDSATVGSTPMAHQPIWVPTRGTPASIIQRTSGHVMMMVMADARCIAIRVRVVVRLYERFCVHFVVCIKTTCFVMLRSLRQAPTPNALLLHSCDASVSTLSCTLPSHEPNIERHTFRATPCHAKTIGYLPIDVCAHAAARPHNTIMIDGGDTVPLAVPCAVNNRHRAACQSGSVHALCSPVDDSRISSCGFDVGGQMFDCAEPYINLYCYMLHPRGCMFDVARLHYRYPRVR